jgi:sugar phosphate isomerase/epimerase
MMLTRRRFVAVGALAAADVKAQPARPALCLFTKHLAKLHYTEIGAVVKQMGFDGVDLTVRPGGHVLPEKVPVDMTRAIESIRGEGVEVSMISTGLVSATDPAAVNIIGIAGRVKIPYFKPGYWRYKPGQPIEHRLAEVKRDAVGLVGLAQHFGIQCGWHNHSGDYVGHSVWDTREIIRDMDPRWIGYYYDVRHATAEGGDAGWRMSLEMALPRLKMVALKDFYWEKSGGRWRAQNCPLGHGMVDWQRFFRMLAAARFAGPISLHVEYNPPDELSAIAQDVAFAKKQLAAAYGS